MFTLRKSNLRLAGKLPAEWFEVTLGESIAKFYDIDDSICRHMKQSLTFWEPRHLISSLNHLTADSVVVDCGANFGNHAIFYAQHCKTVHAIEPVPGLLQLLKFNMSLNKITNILTYGNVLSDSVETFVADIAHCIDAGGVMNWGTPQFKNDPHGGFKSCRLDDLVSGKVDWLKIDVEGAEYRVLAGAQRILESKPVIWLEEHNGPQFQKDARSCIDYLKNRGYHAHMMDSGLMRDQKSRVTSWILSPT